VSNNTFQIISGEEYQTLRRHSGIMAIPSMRTFIVKHTNGIPTRAKSRIFVLGNLDCREWGKSNCFSPVVSIPMIHFLTALAVQNGRTLKQGDCKFAFIQATLPDNELTIIKPPIGCPFSSKSTYWKLRKFLYGLGRAPHHWYDMLHWLSSNLLK
jgi:hypothetical protein